MYDLIGKVLAYDLIIIYARLYFFHWENLGESSSTTCPVDKAWGEKVESSAATEASNPALVKCKYLPS